jgi:hypothetical protein
VFFVSWWFNNFAIDERKPPRHEGHKEKVSIGVIRGREIAHGSLSGVGRMEGTEEEGRSPVSER